MCEACVALKTKESIVYEDAVCAVLYMDKDVNKEAVRVYPKVHASYLWELPRPVAVHLFKVAGKVASTLFELVHAQGTNIVANDGVLDEHVHVAVIPRRDDDGLKLMWEPKQASREELDKVEKKLKGPVAYLTVQGKEPEQPVQRQEAHVTAPAQDEEKAPPEDERSERIDYLIRSINRIP